MGTGEGTEITEKGDLIVGKIVIGWGPISLVPINVRMVHIHGIPLTSRPFTFMGVPSTLGPFIFTGICRPGFKFPKEATTS